jgi:hypothetical protein
VLDKTGRQRRWFYRFRNPLPQPFVILTGLARQTVDEDLVAALRSEPRAQPQPVVSMDNDRRSDKLCRAPHSHW